MCCDGSTLTRACHLLLVLRAFTHGHDYVHVDDVMLIFGVSDVGSCSCVFIYISIHTTYDYKGIAIGLGGNSTTLRRFTAC